MARAWPLWRDRRGIAAVEAALVFPFVLLPMLALVVGSGEGLQEQYRLDRAMHAALIYAWGYPTASDSEIQAAAQGSYGNGPTAMQTATVHSYLCIQPTGTRASGTATVSGATCPNGQVRGTWVTVTLRATLATTVPLPGAMSSWSLSSVGTARIQ